MLQGGAFDNTAHVTGPACVQLRAMPNWHELSSDSVSARGSVASLSCASGGGADEIAHGHAASPGDVHRGHSDALLHAVYLSGAATLSSSWGQPLLQHLSPGAVAHLTASLLTLQCRAVLGATSLQSFPYVIAQRVSRVFHSALPGGRAVSDPLFTALLLAPPAGSPANELHETPALHLCAEDVLGISAGSQPSI